MSIQPSDSSMKAPSKQPAASQQATTKSYGEQFYQALKAEDPVRRPFPIRRLDKKA